VKEKYLDSVVWTILPKNVADSVCQKGSCLAHLHGLPKTHKTTLAMQPILSASGTNCTIILCSCKEVRGKAETLVN